MMARASDSIISRVAALVTAQRGKGAALAREMQHALTHHADVADTHIHRATEWRHGRRTPACAVTGIAAVVARCTADA